MIGGSSVTATRNVPFEVLYPQIGQTMFPDTDAKHFVRATSKQSVHGSETGYTKVTATNRRQIVPNDNYYYENHNNKSHHLLTKQIIYLVTNQ